MSKLGENSGRCANTSETRNYAQNLRVLAVDDNIVCLKFLTTLLTKCNYHVTATTKSNEAYKILMNNRDSYDLVLTNVKANKDGFRLAEMILKIQLDIPIVFVSANDGKELVREGVRIGVDYLPKPVRLEDVKLIWKHVARRDHLQKLSPKKDKMYPSLVRSLTWDRQSTSEKEAEIKTQLKDETNKVPPKQRLKWEPEMHDKFVAAVNKLGIDNAVPKKILEIMAEPTLSRDNVASHLQKYRKILDKEKGHAKISSSVVNKLMIHSSQSTWPRHEVQGTYSSRPVENENGHFESVACFFDGHNPNGGSMTMPTNSLPMLLLSSSYGRNQLRDSTKSPHISLPNTFLPMAPSISFYGPNHLNGSTQLTLMPHPINSRAMPPPSPPYVLGSTQSAQMVETVNSIVMVPPSSSCGSTLIQGSTHPSSTSGTNQIHYSTQLTPRAQLTNSLEMEMQSSSNGQLKRLNSLDRLQNYYGDYLNSDIENDEDIGAMWEVHSAPTLDHPN